MRIESEISDAGEESDVAKLNRISAQRGFPAGDPRAGPFDQRQVDEARNYLSAADRWSLRLSADLYAVRLQYGRGMGRRRTSAMFGISDGVIAGRKELPPPRNWIPNMSDRDRRNLARHVWLGGLLRQIMSGSDPDAVLDALQSASEWKNVDDEEELIWLPEDAGGEGRTMTVHKEISDDEYYTDKDPYRDERIAMLAKLEAELDAINALDDEDEEGEAEEDQADEDQEGQAEGAMAEAHDTTAGLEGVLQSE